MKHVKGVDQEMTYKEPVEAGSTITAANAEKRFNRKVNKTVYQEFDKLFDSYNSKSISREKFLESCNELYKKLS
jgi:hypothetical protein